MHFKVDTPIFPAQMFNKDGVITIQDPDLQNGHAIINTMYMYERDYHVFMLVARKDTRILTLYQTMYISKGEPPKAGI